MERLLELKTPPVKGETYLVPVTTAGGKLDRPVAVLGVVHNDRELGIVDRDHVHIDVRFTPREDLIGNGPLSFHPGQIDDPLGALALGLGAVGEKGMEPDVREEPRVCLAADFPQDRGFKAGRDGLLSLEAACHRDKGFRLNPGCKVCPHKGTRLDNVKPRDGVILCPAHGMEFDAATGEVLEF